MSRWRCPNCKLEVEANARPKPMPCGCGWRAEALESPIERNKREGLLCACNAVRVPYGPPPGTLELGDTLHGYEECVTLRKLTPCGTCAWCRMMKNPIEVDVSNEEFLFARDASELN